MRRAAYLILPSVTYENFPRSIAEAFASGLPVIASRLGSLAEIVEDGRTGLLFGPGSAEELAQRIAWADAHPAAMQAMGENARCEYEMKYTPAINYRQLISIYEEAVASARESRDEKPMPPRWKQSATEIRHGGGPAREP